MTACQPVREEGALKNLKSIAQRLRSVRAILYKLGTEWEVLASFFLIATLLIVRTCWILVSTHCIRPGTGGARNDGL